MSYLYFNIGMRITIDDNLVFTVCQSLHIERSVQVLTDTAKLELPREFKNAADAGGKTVDLSGKSIAAYIQRGSKIKIELGYDDDLQTEFEGYITKIGADTPLTLECEDEMYMLKKTDKKITKSITSGKLKDVLKAILPSDYSIECNEDYTIGKWVIEQNTPYEVLEELRSKLGIRAYFKESKENSKKLYVGMTIDFKPQQVYDYNFSKNVRQDKDTSLKFEVKEDRVLEVVVKSKQKNGKELSYTAGKKGGDTKTINMPQLTEKELKVWGDQAYKTHSYDGFEGTVNGWCYPRTTAGDAARLYRPFYVDGHQNGTYFIESVTIDLNAEDGIKRSNKLSYKLE